MDEKQLNEIEQRAERITAYGGATTDEERIVGEDVPALLAEVKRLNAVVQMLGSHLQGGAHQVKDIITHLDHVRQYAERCAGSANSAYAKAGRELIGILEGREVQ